MPVSHKENGNENHRAQKVHRRAGKKNDYPLPRFSVVESFGIILCSLFVLALERAITAERQAPDGKQQPVFHSLFENCRTEPYGKLVHLKAELTPCDKVPEFVNDNHKHQRQKAQQNVQNRFKNPRKRNTQQHKSLLKACFF